MYAHCMKQVSGVSFALFFIISFVVGIGFADQVSGSVEDRWMDTALSSEIIDSNIDPERSSDPPLCTYSEVPKYSAGRSNTVVLRGEKISTCWKTGSDGTILGTSKGASYARLGTSGAVAQFTSMYGLLNLAGKRGIIYNGRGLGVYEDLRASTRLISYDNTAYLMADRPEGER